MTPKTPNEKLNFVLWYLTHERSYPDAYREINEHENFKGQFSGGEIDLILEKLREDGYIDFLAGSKIVKDLRATDGLSVRRNFNGMVFNEAGGYVQRELNERQQIIDDNARNQRMERNEEQLTSWTRRLTVATILAAILIVGWEMMKFYYYEGHSLCH